MQNGNSLLRVRNIGCNFDLWHSVHSCSACVRPKGYAYKTRVASDEIDGHNVTEESEKMKSKKGLFEDEGGI